MSEHQNRRLGPGQYDYHEVDVGDHYETAGIKITEAQIAAFAGLSGDFFDIHVDDEAAREAGFPCRIGHGLLGLALADGLKVRAKVQFGSIATLKWDWSFKAPLIMGDRISARITVAGKRLTRNPERGILTLHMSVVNQDGSVIQEGETLLMCRASREAE